MLDRIHSESHSVAVWNPPICAITQDAMRDSVAGRSNRRGRRNADFASVVRAPGVFPDLICRRGLMAQT